MATELDTSEDTLDVRDLIERFEELEEERQALEDAIPEAEQDSEEQEAALEALKEWDEDNGEEFKALKDGLDEMKGYGGDHQWKGDWYPIGLVRDSYWVEYCKQYADDVGAIDKNSAWPNSHIDWDSAAADLQQDYSSVEIGGVTYWYR